MAWVYRQQMISVATALLLYWECCIMNLKYDSVFMEEKNDLQ